MTEVLIGSSTEYLLLTADEMDPIVQTLTAELASDGLRAVRTVVHSYSSGFGELAQFFNGLVTDWRGWSGARQWDSLEGDLSIEARHEYRHVHLRITLRADGPGWGNEGWKAIADVTLDPGEQLSQIAVDLARLAGRP